MPFAARKDDDGTWRLCLRMGPTFRRALFTDREEPIGPFPSQAKTKDCAEQLNTRWKEYAAAVKRQDVSDELIAWMFSVIDAHGGHPESQTPRKDETTK